MLKYKTLNNLFIFFFLNLNKNILKKKINILLIT